ncbi:MAG: AAA family ATPase [Propionibacteriaceae bacterium]|nr:AAA family ATPase [Propionibacteriaceae bacterium]
MWIVGRPGMGKTWQLRKHLELSGFEVFSVSAADLESKDAGEPAKLLQRRYLEAGRALANGTPASLVVDDIDTTVGEWETHTGTVNHEGILAFLMHIADRPTAIESVGTVKRVPVFFTGNDATRLYAPLVRHGRTVKFHWHPTREEKVVVISSILGVQTSQKEEVERLVDSYPDEPISFFSQLAVARAVGIVSASASAATFSAVLRGDESHAADLRQLIRTAQQGTDWLAAAAELDSKEMSDA